METMFKRKWTFGVNHIYRGSALSIYLLGNAINDE